MNITIHHLKIHMISTLGSLNIGSAVLANNQATHIENQYKPGMENAQDSAELHESSTRLES